MIITIVLTSIGTNAGPTFDIYVNVNGWTAVATEVDGALLLGGFTLDVPDETTKVRIRSHNNDNCTGYTDINVSQSQSEIFFDNLSLTNEAVMGVTSPLSGTYDITLMYSISAYVDNSLNITQPHTSSTLLEISTNDGISYTTINQVVAKVDGGIMRSDSNTITNTYIALGISDVSKVRIKLTANCGNDAIGSYLGSGNVTISKATSSVGLVTITCYDRYQMSCDDGYLLDCTIP